MPKEEDTFDTPREVDRRIRHERLDEALMHPTLLKVTALMAAAALAAAVCHEKMNNEVEQVPVEQGK